MNPFSLVLVLAVAVPAASVAAQQPDSANRAPRDSAVTPHRHEGHRGQRHYEALQTAAGNAHWARVSASLKARAVLTEEQRGKVRGWADLRGGRWHSKGW